MIHTFLWKSRFSVFFSAMDGNLNDNASLRARIKELERGMLTCYGFCNS